MPTIAHLLLEDLRGRCWNLRLPTDTLLASGLDDAPVAAVSTLLLSEAIQATTGVPPCLQRLVCNGKPLEAMAIDSSASVDDADGVGVDEDDLHGNRSTTHSRTRWLPVARLSPETSDTSAPPVIRLLLGLSGGKGGFGTILRSLGAKFSQVKTTNYDACRDLTGRRIGHVNTEKQLAESLIKQQQQQSAVQAKDGEKKAQKTQKLAAALQGPATSFDHQSYVADLRDIESKVDDAVSKGLSAEKSNGVNPRKHRAEDDAEIKTVKKSRMLLDEDLSDMSDDESGNEGESDQQPSLAEPAPAPGPDPSASSASASASQEAQASAADDAPAGRDGKAKGAAKGKAKEKAKATGNGKGKGKGKEGKGKAKTKDSDEGDD